MFKKVGLLILNLNTLIGYVASEYMPEIIKGGILLIEDKNFYAETLEKEFSILKVGEIFNKLGNLIIYWVERAVS